MLHDMQSALVPKLVKIACVPYFLQIALVNKVRNFNNFILVGGANWFDLPINPVALITAHKKSN